MKISLINKFEKIHPNKIRYFKNKIKNWHKVHNRNFLWRETTNPYKILIAEIFLQQTDVNKVLHIYSPFLHEFPNISILSKAEYSNVAKYINKVGLSYRTNRILNIAKIIQREYNSDIPSEQNILLSLPGIGRYIANAVSCSAYNKKCEIVDTNIVRLFNRFFNIVSKSKRPRNDKYLWEIAFRLLPQKPSSVKFWNWALLDFSALVCKHYNPECVNCQLKKHCCYYSTKCA